MTPDDERLRRLLELESEAASSAEIAHLREVVASAGIAAVRVPPEDLAAWLQGGGALHLVAALEDGDFAAVVAAAGEAAAAGAQEIDLPAPHEAVSEGDIGLVAELIEACRAAAGPSVKLKLMLDPCRLGPLELTAAARAAVMAEVDFLGLERAEDLERSERAAELLVHVVREAAGRLGLKLPASDADSAALIALVERQMGTAWIEPGRLRLAVLELP